jgi:hypothetical protein
VIGRPERTAGASALIGIAAIAFSVLYFVSDLIELAQGGFSTPQLVLTYVAEAALPFLVLGLYAAQRPQIGRLGLVSALTYAYSFVFFTSTVVYALISHTKNWDALTAKFGPWITIHSVLMVLAGIMFGAAVIRARVMPRWTGITLIAGMGLMAVTASLPAAIRTGSAGVRDLAFAAMGASLLRSRGRVDVAHPGDPELESPEPWQVRSPRVPSGVAPSQ